MNNTVYSFFPSFTVRFHVQSLDKTGKSIPWPSNAPYFRPATDKKNRYISKAMDGSAPILVQTANTQRCRETFNNYLHGLFSHGIRPVYEMPSEISFTYTFCYSDTERKIIRSPGYYPQGSDDAVTLAETRFNALMDDIKARQDLSALVSCYAGPMSLLFGGPGSFITGKELPMKLQREDSYTGAIPCRRFTLTYRRLSGFWLAHPAISSIALSSFRSAINQYCWAGTFDDKQLLAARSLGKEVTSVARKKEGEAETLADKLRLLIEKPELAKNFQVTWVNQPINKDSIAELVTLASRLREMGATPSPSFEQLGKNWGIGNTSMYTQSWNGLYNWAKNHWDSLKMEKGWLYNAAMSAFNYPHGAPNSILINL